MAALRPLGLSWGRVRVPIVWAALALLIANAVFEVVPFWPAFVAFALAMAVYLRLGAPPRRRPVETRPPVAGRWRALNSPADRVPSHGLHAYGQTWAIDLVAEPSDGSRPATAWWPLGIPPQRFPGFGAEVLAPAPGTVLAVHDGARDHWSRNSWPGFAFLLLESGVRELTGPGRILGNHVILDLGDGVYAVLAHLQRGSIAVEPGDAVEPGAVIGRCGNSGTSSEPHLHFQLMDHPRVALANGIPFAFPGLRSADGQDGGVPNTKQPFVA